LHQDDQHDDSPAETPTVRVGPGSSARNAEPPVSSPSERTVVGKTVGSIRVVRRLAVGGMGEVFEGFDESLERRVALKAIRPDRATLGGRARLRREARILSRLSDPRICTIHGWLEDPEGDFLVLEYIEGSTLAGSGRLPYPEVLRVGAELADVLAAAHQQGVIHRDLKPSNVMLGADGSIKVLDFGVSSVGVATDTEDISAGSADGYATRQGALVGTPAYMSPEQARGERATPASDIYALGLVLAELATGSAPAGSTTTPDELLELRRGGAGALLDGVPRDLATLLEAMTAPAPAARPAAALVAKQMAAIRDAPRRRMRRAAAAAVVVLAALLGLLYTSRLARERNAAREAEQEATLARREAEQVVEFLESMFETTGPARRQSEQVTARELVQRGAERIRHELNEQPAARARLAFSIGKVALQLGALDQAEELLDEALALQEQLAGADSPTLIPMLGRCARLRMEQSRPTEGLTIAERALAISERSGDPWLIAAQQAEVGAILSELARHDQALELVGQAWATVEASPAGAPPNLRRRVLQSLANSSRRAGKLEQAAGWYEALHELDAGGAVPLFERGSILYNHGITLSQLGRRAEAAPVLEQAGVVMRQAFGEVNHEVAKVENALAILDRDEQRFEQAERRFREALGIWQETLGPDAINVGHALNNLGNLLMRQDRAADAEPYYRQALAIFEKRLGEDHSNTSMTLINLARGLASLGRTDEALALGQRAVAIGKRIGGDDHPDLGWDLMVLAQIRWRIRPSDEARAMAARGRRIVTTAVGPDHPELAAIIAETPELFGE
jgi:serine/threonine-protein kinase